MCTDMLMLSMKVAAQQNLKKTRKKVEQLKDQPSKTAGLETVLSLAVGCRVMLRRVIDVTVGLVNGAIGTVMASSLCINKINRLRSKFRNDLTSNQEK
uniref:DNA helicase Pif1-like 2B domain-containing protein n=1 Tax=Amphimedon queenslandica TaxID=400682 RepID=A0A1X7VXD3_AMPQE